MNDRFDVVNFKKSQGGKTYAVRLGSAVQRKDGGGWNLYLDAIPAPEDGQYRLAIVPPRDQQQREPRRTQAADMDEFREAFGKPAAFEDFQDEVPF